MAAMELPKHVGRVRVTLDAQEGSNEGHWCDVRVEVNGTAVLSERQFIARDDSQCRLELYLDYAKARMIEAVRGLSRQS